ncbi:MAG: hypothetical protein RLZ35_1046 [Pseudomonadota bacterium]|jgi:putative transposase
MGYPSDLTDQEWAIIEHHFDAGNYGNRRKHTVKILVDAIFYLTKTGCQWRQLPKDFPPWKTVHTFYRRAKERGIWEKMMGDLVAKSRKKNRQR